MTIKNLFVKELNYLAGQTVEVTYDDTTIVGVVDYARDDVLALVETAGGTATGTSTIAGAYGAVNTVVYITLDSIDFVRLL